MISIKKIKQILSFIIIGVYSIQLNGQINVNKTTAKLGTITTEKPITTEFIIYNKSTVPLTLISATASSANLSVKYPQKTIAPNDSSTITATFYPQDLYPGPFKKPIRIKCNGNPSTFTLFIAGNISDVTPSRQYRNDWGFTWVRLFEHGKYGAEVTGKRIIAPTYQKLEFDNALQRFLCINDKVFSMTDASGKQLFCSTDMDKYDVDKKGIVIKESSGAIYIDKNGNIIIGRSHCYINLAHTINNNGEYFTFWKSNTSGIIDKNGKVLFETSNTHDEMYVSAYYVNGCVIYVTKDGMYDYRGNKVVTFNFVPRYPFEIPYIDDEGNILTLIENKIGSIKDLNFPPSANPFL